MYIKYKLFIEYSTLLFYEKLCYDSTDLSIVYSDNILKRIDFNINFAQDTNLTSLCILSFPIIPSVFKIKRNGYIFSYCVSIYGSKILTFFPYIFFSMVTYLTNSHLCYSVRSTRPTNSSISFTVNIKSVSMLLLFDSYFHGIVDADYKFNINMDVLLHAPINNMIIKNIFASLLCIPFISKIG